MNVMELATQIQTKDEVVYNSLCANALLEMDESFSSTLQGICKL